MITETPKKENKESEIEEAWVAVLGAAFKAVDWKKMRGRRRWEDIFEHRVSYARYEQTIPDVIQRLCNALSLQAPDISIEKIDFLRQNEEEALEMIRRWTKLLTLQAARWAGYY